MITFLISLNSTTKTDWRKRMNIKKMIVISTILGVVLGIAFAQSDGESILNGAVTCMDEHPMPLPCQSFSTYTCKSGCTWQMVIGSRRTKCAILTYQHGSVCCQWQEETGSCIGTCGTNCPEVIVPRSFTNYMWGWECKPSGIPEYGNYQCRPPEP